MFSCNKWTNPEDFMEHEFNVLINAIESFVEQLQC